MCRIILTQKVAATKDYSPEQITAWAPADMDAAAWATRVQSTRPFVAALDDEIVGFADIQPTGYIDQFFVSGQPPRRGIGSMLRALIHSEAKSLGLTELTSNLSKTAEPVAVGVPARLLRLAIERSGDFESAMTD